MTKVDVVLNKDFENFQSLSSWFNFKNFVCFTEFENFVIFHNP